MPASAHTALVVSIVASALGALVMCLLVARYGLSMSGGDDPERGWLVTRFGHAFAGVCFAATGILALVALVAPTRDPRPAPATVVKIEPDRAAEARVQALGSEVKAITTRLDQAEERMTVMDGTARRLGDEVGSMSARAQHLERTIAALPRRAVAEPPVKEAKRAPAPSAREPVKEPSRGPVAPPVAIEAPVSPPTASPSSQIPEPVAAPARSTPEHVVAPRPRAPSASARLTAPSGRATIEAPARSSDGGAAMGKSEEMRLPDKIREDWKTVRGGLSTAGDDFKAAVKDLGRKLWR
jgi:hypothetical protein